MTLSQWQDRGHYHDIQGYRVFTIDEGAAEKTLLILHGYPSASFDYWRVLPFLTAHFRVIIHDHLGFGLSGKPEQYSYSLIDQTDIALQLWQHLNIREGYLLGHDYGTSIATEIIARRELGFEPVKLQGVLLGNGSMLIELSRLRIIQRLLKHSWFGPLVARLSSKSIFDINMKRLWGNRTKVDQKDLDILWHMLNYDEGKRVLPRITRYIEERYTFWHRWVGSLYRTDLPISLLWAEEDPVAVVEMAHELHRHIPHSRLRLLPGIGHYPMLEAPQAWAAAVVEMLNDKN